MLENYARPMFQKWCVDPVAKGLIKTGIIGNPLWLTLIAGIFGLLAFVFLCLKLPMAAIISILLSGYSDILDGTFARLSQTQSSLGAVCDILMDRMVEVLIILGLFCYVDTAYPWIFMLMLSSTLICVTSFLVVGIFSENNSQKSFYYSPGLMERAEAFIFYIAMILLPQWILLLGLLYSILVFTTALLRVYEFAVTR